MIKKNTIFSLFLLLLIFFTSFVQVNAASGETTYDDTNNYYFTSDKVNDITNYGVNWKKIDGTSKNGKQQVNLFSMKTNGETSKLVTWMVQDSSSTYIRKTTVEAAKDFEANNPGWIVIGGINADQWYQKYGTGVVTDGSDKYYSQTYYPYGQNYENIFPISATGNSASNFVGIDNNGSLVSATGLKGTFLSIYDSENNLVSKYQVAGFNRAPSANEITVWSGYYDGGSGVYKKQEVSSQNTLIVVNKADTAHMNNTTAYADYKPQYAVDSFFGKGAITSLDQTTASLDKGAFAIDTANQEIKNSLAVGTYIKVEMEYIDDALNQCESITGYHSVQRLNGVDQPVSGGYNTSSYPRSVFGIKDDGTYVLFTCDKGNGFGGLNGWEINACLKQYGVTTAYQDDGGGSVTAIWRNENNGFDVVNTPRDGAARNNLTHLFFVVRAEEYKLNYELNGGYYLYESYEAMQNEFLNDFNNYCGKTFTKANFFDSTWSATIRYATDFFVDSVTGPKWKWILNYFNDARASSGVASLSDDNGVLRGEIHGFLNNTKFVNANAAYTNSSDYSNPDIRNKWLSFIETDVNIATTYNNLQGIKQLATPTKDGYTFRGWYLTSDFSGSKVESIPAGTTGDITLYAKWTLTSSLTTQTVTYNLNGGVFDWENTSITAGKGTGIDSVSKLPLYFATDFYTYLLDNNLLNSETVYNELTYYANCYESFVKKGTDGIISVYNKTKNDSKNFVDGYSQYYFDSISDNGATGGFFGTEPYKSKYENLLFHIKQMTDINYSDVTDIGKYKTSFGFTMDTYFFGSSDLIDGKENFETYNYLRSVVVTSSVLYQGINKADNIYAKNSFMSDESLTLPTPFKEGYRFVGWYTDEALTNKIEVATSSVTVYAKYESLASKVYSVKFINGDGEVISDQIVKEGLDAFVPKTATKTQSNEYRYTFKEWDKEATNITSDLEINAIFNEIKKTYTISFKVNGRNYSTQTLEYGATIVYPEDPVKEGYVFIGWDSDVTTVTSSLTINAIFEQLPEYYTVKFYIDGQIYDEQQVAPFNAATKPADPLKENYNFTGWDKDFSNITSDLDINAIFEEIPAPTPDPNKKDDKGGCFSGSIINLSLLVIAIYIFRKRYLH